MGLQILFASKGKKDFLSVLNHYSSLLNQEDYVESITVVDFDADTNLDDYCKQFNLQYIGYFQERFNKAKALNIGIKQLFGRFPEGDVLICDADVIISAETLQRMYVAGLYVILEKVVESSTNAERLAYGIIKSRIKDIYNIGGYDSRFEGWGFEDHDIIWRLTINGATFIKLGTAIHLSHGDDERTQFYHSVDLKRMREVNKRFYEKKQLIGDVIGTIEQDNL